MASGNEKKETKLSPQQITQIVMWCIKNWRSVVVIVGGLWIAFGEYQQLKEGQAAIAEMKEDYYGFKDTMNEEMQVVSQQTDYMMLKLDTAFMYFTTFQRYKDRFDIADSISQFYMFDVDVLFSVVQNMMEVVRVDGIKFYRANTGQFYYPKNGTMYFVRKNDLTGQYRYVDENGETQSCEPN